MLKRMLILFVTLSVSALAQNTPTKTTLIKAGRVLDVKAGVYLPNQGVLVAGDRIKDVGAFDAVKARAPQDAVIIDLGQATLLPGLIDCHGYLLCSMEGRWFPAGEAIVMAINRIGPAKRALIGAANARDMLEAGFTAVRNVGHSGVNGDAASRGHDQRGGVDGRPGSGGQRRGRQIRRPDRSRWRSAQRRRRTQTGQVRDEGRRSSQKRTPQVESRISM
jgi:Imidazolonepropionase-like composite domain, bacteria